MQHHGLNDALPVLWLVAEDAYIALREEQAKFTKALEKVLDDQAEKWRVEMLKVYAAFKEGRIAELRRAIK